MSELRPQHHFALNLYRHIYYTYGYGDRAPYFTGEDEKVIERIYNEWRNTNIKVSSCDDCIEESFNRLMEQVLKEEKENRHGKMD